MKNSLSLSRLFLFGSVICALIVVPLALDLTHVPRFMFFSALSLLLVYFLYQSHKELKLHVDVVLASYFAYTLFCCFSLFWSQNKAEALFSAEKQVAGLFAFLFSVFFLKQNKYDFMATLFKISILVALVLFVVVSYQIIHTLNFVNVEKDALYEITGLNGHKNLLSSFLFLNLFFLACACIQLPKAYRIISLCCIVISLAVLFVLKTKAVWLGALATLFVFGILFTYKKINKIFFKQVNTYVIALVLITLINIFFFFFFRPIINKSLDFTQTTENTAMKLEQERLVLWYKTYDMIDRYPLLGVGCGNWQIEMPNATLVNLWRGEDLNFTFQRPHNDFLWILSETGLIGFNLYLFFVIALLLFSVKALKMSGNKQSIYLLMFCVAFIIGYFVISFFDFPKERMEHGIWLNMIVAVAYYHIGENRLIQNLKSIRLSKLVYFAAMLLLLFMTYTGVLRCRGEFFTRNVYNGKHENNPSKVIKAGYLALNFAYTIDPLSVPIYWYTGNAHAQLGNYQAAYKDFLQAFHYNPYNRNVLNDLASACVMIGDTLQGKSYYKEIVRISPRFDEAKLNLAAICISEKKFKEASHWLSLILHDSERRSQYQHIVDFMLNQKK